MSIAKPYLDQYYEEIKSRCLNSGQLFVDDQFPADVPSIAKFFPPPYVEIEWKRTKDFISEPKFLENGPNPNDLNQGKIGDCWFIAGAVAVSQYPEFFNYVVPQDQSFDEGDYCGAFHFRFWRYGEWLDVVIDDYLPVNIDTNRLVYCSNQANPNELWCALFEKAYAKLNTCYEFLDAGKTTDAIIDLTGGVDEEISIAKLRIENELGALWKYLKQAHNMKSLAGASFFRELPEGATVFEATLDNGLIANHAYTITKVAEIDSNHEYYEELSSAYADSNAPQSIRLIRLRNPWGGDNEWNGRFSDSSPEWQNISDSVKAEIGLVKEKDGEFWMPFEDFIEFYETISLVHCDINSFFDIELETNKRFKWNSKMFQGRLERSDQQVSDLNPQYLVTLNDVDPTDTDNTATLIVSLMQTDSIKFREETYGQYNDQAIYFAIYKVITNRPIEEFKENNLKFNVNYDLEEVENLGEYVQLRSVTKRFKLPPGNYVIIPSTYYDIELNFLLRFFTEIEITDSDLSLLNQSAPSLPDQEESFLSGSTTTGSSFNDDSTVNGKKLIEVDVNCKNSLTKEKCSIM